MATLLTSSWNDANWVPFVTPEENMFSGPATSVAAGSNLAGNAKMMQKVGLFGAVMGAVNSAIGTYYQAKSAQYQAASQSSTLKFQADMAKINAHSQEINAQSIMDAGQKQVGQYTMQAGQAKAAAKTAMGSRGIALGEGSTRDVEASMDLIKSVDTLTINSNTVRAAEAARMQGVNYQNQSLLDLTSAKNVKATAGTVNPGMNTVTSLLGSATNLTNQWYYKNSRYGINSLMSGQGY